MKDITHLYNGAPVRTVIINGELFFRLSDIGSILEVTNPYRYDFVKKGSRIVTTLTSGGNQNVVYINEPALYRIIFKSRKKEAVNFQDWVFECVLPKIRKTGRFDILDEDERKKSVDARKGLTKAWQDRGIETEYGILTNAEYKELGFPSGIRKRAMDKEQLLKLKAFEALETLNLHYNDAYGFIECRQSLKFTGKAIKSIEQASSLPVVL